MNTVTKNEIAAALGRDRSVVSRRAAREGWPYKAEPSRGGQRHHYFYASLPVDVQYALHGTIMAGLAVQSDALATDLVRVRRKIAALDRQIAAALGLEGEAADE